LFHPKNAIPVDLEPNNLLFVVPIEDVVAVFRRVEDPLPPPSEETTEDIEDIEDLDDLQDLDDFDE